VWLENVNRSIYTQTPAGPFMERWWWEWWAWWTSTI